MSALKPAKHGRDHCPGGEDEIPCWPGQWARVSRGFDAANQAVANSTIVTMTPNREYNMAAGDSGEGFFEPFGNGIRVLADSILLVKVGIFWVEGFSAPIGIGFQDGAAGGHWLPGQHQAALGLWEEGCWVQRVKAGTTITATFYQVSGSGKNIDAAVLELVRMGVYTGADWNTMNPDQ